MYNQSFTHTELAKCQSMTFIRHLGYKDRETYAEAIHTCIGDNLWEGTYHFALKHDQYSGLTSNGHTKANELEFACQDLIMRKIAKNIKRLYYIRFANRNRIIRQIISLLNDTSDFCVLRTDVSSFYESINRDLIQRSLNEKGRLSVKTMDLLRDIFKFQEDNNLEGLPRGLCISSVLSELYMKRFDLEVKKMDGIYFYARYVDDIIVFCANKEVCKTTKKDIAKRLKEIGLRLNKRKTLIWENNSTQPLEYLGYTFKKNSALEITIAQAKVNRIKTRITRTFLQFAKDKDVDNLVLRMKYLTGNFRLNSAKSIYPIPIGLYYNYKYITNFENLSKELNTYYKRILFSKRFGCVTIISKSKMNVLKKMDFNPHLSGKSIRIWHKFDSKKLSIIKQCWL